MSRTPAATFGQGLLAGFATALAGLVLLVVLKVGLDLRAHMQEHRKAQSIER